VSCRKHTASNDCGGTDGKNKETPTSLPEREEKRTQYSWRFRPVSFTESVVCQRESIQIGTGGPYVIQKL